MRPGLLAGLSEFAVSSVSVQESGRRVSVVRKVSALLVRAGRRTLAWWAVCAPGG